MDAFAGASLCPSCLMEEALGLGQPSTVRPAPSETPGTRVGPYKLLQKLGEGGMGIVWMAEQTEPIRRVVALKVIKHGMDSDRVLARFEAERQALALMNHAHIAKIFDAGVTGASAESALVSPQSPMTAGRPYFVMELVKGIPITRFCDEQRLSIGERLELFMPVCQAIQHAHQKGVIHRDIKPSNILVALYDGHPVAKVIDFGIAKATGQQLTARTLFTEFGAVIGTPEYMSPEQAELNQLDIDTRSDIYSLGVLLYELLTGTTPLTRDALGKAAFDEILRRIREEEPPKPSTRLSDSAERLDALSAQRQLEPARLTKVVRGDLDWIVMKALEKDRNRRYESATALASDLQRFLANEPVLAGPPTARYRLNKFIRKHRAAVATTAGMVLLLAAATIVSTASAVRTSRANANAQHARREATANAEDARATLDFLRDNLLSAARADGLAGGQGLDVTVSRALEKAEPQVAVLFTNRPKVEAEVRAALGVTFGNLGKYTEAVRQLQRAVELATNVFGWQDGRTVNYQDSLATALVDVGKAAEAIPLLQYSLGWRVAKGGTNQHTLSTLGSLASAYHKAGRFAESLELYTNAIVYSSRLYGGTDRRTLRLRIDHGGALTAAGQVDAAIDSLKQCLDASLAGLGQSHDYTMVAMNNLGDAYSAAHRRADALHIWEQLLVLLEKANGPNHPQTLNVRQNIATEKMQLDVSGRGAQSVAELSALLKQKQEQNGLDHPNTLQTMNNLAVAQEHAGNLRESIQLHEEALRLRRARLGPDHPQTLESMHNLGGAYRASGDLSKALPVLEEVYAARRRLLGPNHHHTLDSANSLANAYRNTEQLAKAIALLEANWNAARTNPGTADPSALRVLVNLGDCHAYSAEPANAVPLLEEAVRLCRKALGPEHDETIAALSSLATAHQHQRHLDQAIPLRQEALALSRKALGPSHPQTLNILFNLGLAEADVGHFADAVKALEEYVDTQKTQVPPTNPSLVRARHQLLTNYRKSGQNEKAIQFGRETVRQCEANLGPTNHYTLDAMIGLASAYRKKGDLTEYPQMLETLFERLKAVNGPDNNDTLGIEHYLAETYRARGRLEQAVALHQDCVQRAMARFKPDHALVLAVRGGLAESYLAAGRYAEAEHDLREMTSSSASHPTIAADVSEMLGEALARLGKSAEAEPLLRDALAHHTSGGANSHRVQFLLGLALLNLKQYDEAAKLLQSAHAGLTEHWSDGPSPVRRIPPREAAEQLVQLYEAWGKPDQAAEWRKRLP
jgi:non-specific serine/threonine protein kinase/serine/threonine-protein kinase